MLKVGEYTVKVDINKLIKYHSQASEDLGIIAFSDDQDIDACIEEVMMIDEEARFEELRLEETTNESRPRGHQLHTVSCQNKVQTYQFN